MVQIGRGHGRPRRPKNIDEVNDLTMMMAIMDVIEIA